MPPSTMELVAACLFGVAVLHTFCVKQLNKLAKQFPEGSVIENVLHLLGEVEVVFIFWATALVACMGVMTGWSNAVTFVDKSDFTEPLFVFVIMACAATKPVVDLADALIRSVARLLPFSGMVSFGFSTLTIGPLLGSFITEPAAMTVTAMILLRQVMQRNVSQRLRYAVLGVLFVNVSIGGTLTHYAAPPVVMVAGKWGWDTTFMFCTFGWKAVLTCAINAGGLLWIFRKELAALSLLSDSDAHNGDAARMKTPVWVGVIHALAIAFIVLNAHHPKVFMGGFVLFLGFLAAAKEYQEPLKLKESLLVGGFLGGLVTLGSLQRWWLEPLIQSMNETVLFWGSTGLTAVTDNAALTFLASQVSGLSDSMKYAVTAGAVTGGGLTVIANAPNPAGNAILGPSFGDEGMSPIKLLKAALIPTLVAAACFLLLPSL